MRRPLVVHSVTLDCGTFKAPRGLVAMMEAQPPRWRRSVFSNDLVKTEEPDPETPLGRQYAEWLAHEQRRCHEWYERNDGTEFVLTDFPLPVPVKLALSADEVEQILEWAGIASGEYTLAPNEKSLMEKLKAALA